MPVKLVRSDGEIAQKVTLPPGNHFIGRGTIFEVQDKRVSRKHAGIHVKDKSITVTALHRNPIYYTKLGSRECAVLIKDSSVELSNGDKIGLLPKLYWFEVIIVGDMEPLAAHPSCSDTETDTMSNTEEMTKMNVTCYTEETLDTNKTVVNNQHKDFETASENNDTTANHVDDDTNENNVGSGLENSSLPTTSLTRTDSEETIKLDTVQKSPGKRAHADDECAVKKIKVEPNDTEEAAGSSNQGIKTEPNDSMDNQAGCSATNGDSYSRVNPGAHPSSVRERCYYGSRCYRRNPLHLVQYSHPKDSDWGTGEKGECPYGAQCTKNDTRHWDTHFHPPGTSQPPQLNGKRKKKRKRQESSTSEDSLPDNIPRNRLRHRVRHDSSDGGLGSDSIDSNNDLDIPESEEDPFGSDDSEDWQPF